MDNKKGNIDPLVKLQCSGCKEHMVPPIKICIDGHAMCSRCRQESLVCPTCSKGLIMASDLELEEIALQTMYPCTNTGCKGEFSVFLIEKHRGSCPFRQYRCPHYLTEWCNWSGVLNGMRTHLQERHCDSTQKRSKLFTINLLKLKRRCIYNVILLRDKMFYRRFEIRYGYLYGVLQYIGPEDTFRKYAYTFKFRNQDKFESMMEKMKKVRNINKDLDDIYEKNCCMKVNYEVVKKYANENYDIEIEMEIFKSIGF